jgi:hypothetical protein
MAAAAASICKMQWHQNVKKLKGNQDENNHMQVLN